MSKLREGRTIFMVLLVALALYFVIAALGYGRNSRIFPLAIGIPTAVLTALALAGVWKPALLLGADVQFAGSSSGTPDSPPEESEEAGDPPLAVLRIVGWLLLAMAGIAIFGFSVTVPIYVLLFGRLEGRASWVLCILSAVASWAFIVGYFDLFMKFRMFRGVLFGDNLPVL